MYTHTYPCTYAHTSTESTPYIPHTNVPVYVCVRACVHACMHACMRASRVGGGRGRRAGGSTAAFPATPSLSGNANASGGKSSAYVYMRIYIP